jgi:hypothetical protein
MDNDKHLTNITFYYLKQLHSTYGLLFYFLEEIKIAHTQFCNLNLRNHISIYIALLYACILHNLINQYKLSFIYRLIIIPLYFSHNLLRYNFFLINNILFKLKIDTFLICLIINIFNLKSQHLLISLMISILYQSHYDIQ